MIFFTSDTHFSHQNILTLANRPFRDIQHHNEMLVKNWNEVVAPDDQVFHLGDVALGSFVDSIQYVDRLNGERYLVPGNHDRVSSTESLARQKRFRSDYENRFHIISEWHEIIQLSVDGPLVEMCHYPYNGDSHFEDRFKDMRPVDNGRVLLHGHTHSKNKISRSARGTLQINVGVDAWGFRPVSEDEIIRLIQENL